MPIKEEQLHTFMRLFQGSVRSFGQYVTKTKSHFTQKREATDDDFRAHLTGKTGIGIVPIVRDRFSFWGAIDIESENLEEAQITIEELEANVQENKFPLITCRSKSGGAHLYLFLSEAITATAMRQTLANWTAKLGFPGVEVFPKQGETSETALGNWINLPYFNAEKTERYAIEGGKKVPFDYFLELVEGRTVSAGQLVSSNEHPEAPPCVQALMQGGINKGMRNEALFQISAYLKKAYPDGWKQRAFDANSAFEAPLPHAEAKKTIDSVGRREYQYKCKSEPARSLCDSNVCVTRKFGITPQEEAEVKTPPAFFSNLKKYLSEPVFWTIDVDGREVTVKTEVLMSFVAFRQAVADAHTRMIPLIKDKEWHQILTALMEKCEIIDTPDDASISGQIRNRLREFLAKASMNGNPELHKRENLLRGMPVCDERGTGRRVVYFRGNDFVEYLKRNRASDLAGMNLWLALRKAGVSHTKIKIGGQATPVWFLDFDTSTGEVEFNVSDFESDV